MEGMASYMAKDETTARQDVPARRGGQRPDPSRHRGDFGGFFAYRFGHAAFDFIEDRWGKEGFRDFLYEFRNTFGSQVGRAVKRAFRMDPEDFDVEFRRWLRKKYLPQAGRDRRAGGLRPPVPGREQGLRSIGDLAHRLALRRPGGGVQQLRAAISTSCCSTPRSRRLLRNLTKGYTNDYQYLVGAVS